MDLVICVKDIKGQCPVYEVGDCFTLTDGYKLQTTKQVCMHSLSSVMPFYNALRFAEPSELGLGGEDGNAFVQCPDPCERTGGGTVVFEIVKKT